MGSIQSQDNSKRANSEGEIEVVNPRCFHQQIPVKLPPRAHDNEGELSQDDKMWARRQFSTLWSPMPSNYQIFEGVGDKVS